MLIQGKTRHLQRIIEALLDLARAAADAERPPLKPITLTPWFRDHLAARVNPLGQISQIDPDDPEPVWVAVGSTLLGELVGILLDNAAKYGEPTSSIVVWFDRAGASARLGVADQGIGIDLAEVPYVTTRFNRSASARSRDWQGLGLGLSIATRISRLFGGRLEVVSRPGKGTTISVVLPVAEAPEASPVPG